MWKQIEGYPNYEVSTEGQVRNVKTNKMLTNIVTKQGRHRVKLSVDGESKGYQVHRLVATTFIPNIEGKPEVDHIDRNRLNNHVSNLRWVTHSENQCNKGYYHHIGNKESQFIGMQANGSFRVQIQSLGKRVYDKTFKTKEEAILYRDQFMADNPR